MQRVARYPLFLNAMLEHTYSDSNERIHLQGERSRRYMYNTIQPADQPLYQLDLVVILEFYTMYAPFLRLFLIPVSHVCIDAVDSMIRVADYINEMQRISEVYSSLFDDMIKESGLAEVSQSMYTPTKTPLAA